MNAEISEQMLNRMYEDLQKEQMKLMNDIKTTNDVGREKETQKQITMINTININVLRLRNLRKQLAEKAN
jgi:hypothetical protein